MTRIITTYDPPPIPTRNHDWTAVLSDYDAGDPIGWGRTRDEAVADLEEQLRDQANVYLEQIEARCDTSPCEYWLREIGARNND